MLSLEITLPEPRYQDSTPATNHFYERLIDKLQQSPVIVSAGTTTALPLQSSHEMTQFPIAGAAPVAPGGLPLEQIRLVSPEFFHAMGLRLTQGRVIYFPGFETHAVLLIRTYTDPNNVVPEVRNIVREINPTQPIYHVETINEVLSDSLPGRR